MVRHTAKQTGRYGTRSLSWPSCLAFSMYLASTMDASHTVVPRLLELGSCASCSVMLRKRGRGVHPIGGGAQLSSL